MSWNEQEKMKLLKVNNMNDVKECIKACEGKHIQQIAYSSYHDALTQICFTCNKVVTNIKTFITDEEKIN